MTINPRYGSLSGNDIARAQPAPADTDDCPGETTPQPAGIAAQQSPWQTQAGQGSAAASIRAQSPPPYDPAARYRSGDTVSMNGKVYTLMMAAGAPKIMGVAPDTDASFGSNPWWYQGQVKNFHDPWSNSATATPASAGESANAQPNIRVTMHASKVVIDMPVQFRGSGLTPQRQARITNAIQKAWSGHFSPYDVTTKVTTPPPNASPSQINTITVLDQPGYSVTDKNNVTLYTSEPGQSPYSRSQLGFVAAHEAGHLMGEPDHYALTDVNGVAGHVSDPGYENNIMGEKGGMVDQRNIQSILRRTS
ncbi:MAG TPA: hypothetical protein VME63_12665 [Dyella sp.]|nr:hypothetical protein [Dyella sp.]